MKHLLIIANPDKNSFTFAMVQAYKEKCEKNGDTCKILDLYEHPQTFLHYESKEAVLSGTTKNDIEQRKYIQEQITWADKLAFFFPVWWGNVPAILKNFFDVNFSSGFAYKYVKGKNMPEKLLTDKTAKIFCTCDAPAFLYSFSFLFGISIKKYLKSAILEFCGVKVMSFQLFGGLRKKTDEQRKQILESIGV